MAPYLDAGILHRADMDRHTDSNQTQWEGGSPSAANPTEALKALHDLLNKLSSKGTLAGSGSQTATECQGSLLDSLSGAAYNTFFQAASQVNQTDNNITPKGGLDIANRIPAYSDSPREDPGVQAANMSILKIDGSASLPGPPTAAKVPDLVTAHGVEDALAPEPEREDRGRQSTTADSNPARTSGSTAAGHGANDAISGIRDQTGARISPSPSPGPQDPSVSNNRLRELAETISRNVDALSPTTAPHRSRPGTPSEDVARIQLISAAEELLYAVRPPPDTIMGWFAQMSVVSAVHVFQHWGVFEIIPAQMGEFISFTELAEKVRAEEALLVRMAWMLTSSNVLRYVPPSDHPEAACKSGGGLAHTPTSLMLLDKSPLASMFKLLHTNVVQTSAIMPSYFDTYGRKEPVGPGHIPTSFLAGQPSLPYFELLGQDQDKVKEFMHAMSITHRRSPITGMFDLKGIIETASRLESQQEEVCSEREKSPAWVDIGGGDGSVVKTFRQANPGLKAEWCVVQDLPEVVEAAKEAATNDDQLKGVQFLPMDFHKDAPVKGALVYYLRHIVRDYSDPVVVNILSNIRKSMIPPAPTDVMSTATTTTSSRILISEQLIPSPAPPMYAAFKDYAMLAVGGKERSLQQFEAVADAAGLVVTGVYRDKGTPHAVVEMQVKV